MKGIYVFLLSVLTFVFIAGIAFVSLYGVRLFNTQTIQTQIINPQENITCVVVISMSNSIAVDCWEKN